MHISAGRVVSNFIMQALAGEDITIYGDGSQTRRWIDSFIYDHPLHVSLSRASTCYSLMPARGTLPCLHVALSPASRGTFSCLHMALSRASTWHSLMPPLALSHASTWHAHASTWHSLAASATWTTCWRG